MPKRIPAAILRAAACAAAGVVVARHLGFAQCVRGVTVDGSSGSEAFPLVLIRAAATGSSLRETWQTGQAFDTVRIRGRAAPAADQSQIPTSTQDTLAGTIIAAE